MSRCAVDRTKDAFDFFLFTPDLHLRYPSLRHWRSSELKPLYTSWSLEYPADFSLSPQVFIGAENLVVKKLRIFSTLFQQVDGTEAFYANSLLSNMKIINVRRSGDMAEGLAFSVGWGTPTLKLDELEKLVSNWLATDEKRDLGSSSAIMVSRMTPSRGERNELTITIFVPSRSRRSSSKIEVGRRSTSLTDAGATDARSLLCFPVECTFGIPHLSTWQVSGFHLSLLD